MLPICCCLIKHSFNSKFFSFRSKHWTFVRRFKLQFISGAYEMRCNRKREEEKLPKISLLLKSLVGRVCFVWYFSNVSSFLRCFSILNYSIKSIPHKSIQRTGVESIGLYFCCVETFTMVLFNSILWFNNRSSKHIKPVYMQTIQYKVTFIWVRVCVCISFYRSCCWCTHWNHNYLSSMALLYRTMVSGSRPERQ